LYCSFVPMKNYYSVRVGHNPDIYEHLDVTQYQITEYPNAQWNGFNVYQHAEAYLGGSQMNIEPRVKFESDLSSKHHHASSRRGIH
jgi:viroplasmin and RNaseH domain-containing protein